MSSRGGTTAQPIVLDDDGYSEDHAAGDERRGDDVEQPPVAKRKKVMKARKPRPKVTLELLKEDRGLPDVYYNFPDAFRKGFKGPGHEVNDLRRLLELYSRWQQRVFPSATFDQFISKVEFLSSNYLLKKELRELRGNLVSVLMPAGDDVDEPQAAHNPAAHRPPPGMANGAAAPVNVGDQERAGSGRAAGPASAAPPPPALEAAQAASRRGHFDEDDDDELEQMQRQAQQQADDESQWDMAMDAVGGLPDSDDEWLQPGAPAPQAPSSVRGAAAGADVCGGSAMQAGGSGAAASAVPLEDELQDDVMPGISQHTSQGDEDTQTRRGRRARGVLLDASDEDDG